MQNKRILHFIICLVTGFAAWFLPLQLLGIGEGVIGFHYFVALLVFFSLLGAFRFIPAMMSIMFAVLLLRACF